MGSFWYPISTDASLSQKGLRVVVLFLFFFVSLHSLTHYCHMLELLDYQGVWG
jgi:hypothetical protein